MLYEIKNRWTDAVIYSAEHPSLRAAVSAALSGDADLGGADLRGAALGGANLRGAALGGANLRDADLRGAALGGAALGDADLGGADLRGADLGGANLRGAALGGANLRDADLRGAALGGADLGGADLGGANLRDANLRGADLRDADLRDADLRDANLRGADLRDADLRGADLGGADLGGANLRGADLGDAALGDADLGGIRDDLWAVLSASPAEVPALISALREGRINGSVYQGACACLVGTLANARHCEYTAIPGLQPNGSRPAERFFLSINTGDTPETNQFSALALEWCETWLTNVRMAFAPQPPELAAVES